MNVEDPFTREYLPLFSATERRERLPHCVRAIPMLDQYKNNLGSRWNANGQRISSNLVQSV